MTAKSKPTGSLYERLITEATGATPAAAAAIEELMREDIFHSTLDWQSRDQLTAAAREAAEMLKELQADGHYQEAL